MKIVIPLTITDSILTSSSVPENDYPQYSAATTYALNDYVIDVGTNIHKVYQSLVGSNVGNALTNTSKWLFIGNTNRWKMHDTSVQSQTIKATSIVNAYAFTTRINSLAALNIEAGTLQVSMVVPVDGTVYNKTFELTSTTGIDNWYKYFFEPVVRQTDFIITDMPSYSSGTLNVTFSASSGNVAVGTLILGSAKDVGVTDSSARVGITSFSTKTQDAFGNYTIVPRAYRKTGQFNIYVNSTYVDYLHKTLTTYRDTPILYIGGEEYKSTYIYGFYKDFGIVISYPTVSICDITIEGLT